MSRSTKALCLAAALAASAGLTPPAAATQVSWIRIPPGCEFDPGEDLTLMPCGGYGNLYFGEVIPKQLSSCQGLRSGTEEPAAYLTPGTLQPAANGFPCQDGTCYGRGRLPWVAVLDWDKPHGWTVGALLREASDQRVGIELFDLEDPAGTLPEWLVGVGDAHVLAQLCRVAKLVSDPQGEPPLAVNMSFGRAAAKEEREDCLPGGKGGLQCEIRGVLAHLRGASGTLPVAAAGNHGALLFPAEDTNVLSAGALDLARFGASGSTEPSNETPSGADGLVPGYGLYLESTWTSWWPAPPGSSYASALLAGWIAGTRVGNPATPMDPGARWTPLPSGSRFLLARNGLPLVGSDLHGPADLLWRALGDEPAVCDSDPAEGANWIVNRIVQPPPPLPELSLVELAAQSNQQQPGAVICVPCHGDQPPGGLEGEGGAPLKVDFRGSSPLPAEYRLTGVYLRIGDVRHRLDRSNHLALLGQISQGTLDVLTISGLDGLLSPGQQVSLVYTLVDLGGTPFWHATPVNVHEH